MDSFVAYNSTARAESETNHLPDISGLAWIEQDTFLAVHDAKNPEENNRPRVSILSLPRTPEGIRWKPLEIDWPHPLKESSDLESIARIPGTSLYLSIVYLFVVGRFWILLARNCGLTVAQNGRSRQGKKKEYCTVTLSSPLELLFPNLAKRELYSQFQGSR